MDRKRGKCPVWVSPGLTECVIDDERVILDETSGKYFGLNSAGSRIFALLKESKGVDEIVTLLGSEYAVPEERLRRDVSAFVERLIECKLAERDARTPGYDGAEGKC